MVKLATLLSIDLALRGRPGSTRRESGPYALRAFSNRRRPHWLQSTGPYLWEWRTDAEALDDPCGCRFPKTGDATLGVGNLNRQFRVFRSRGDDQRRDPRVPDPVRMSDCGDRQVGHHPKLAPTPAHS